MPVCCRNQKFTLTAAYTEDSPLPAGCDRTIGTFTVGPPPHVPSESEAKAKLKVKVSCSGDKMYSRRSNSPMVWYKYHCTVANTVKAALPL